MVIALVLSAALWPGPPEQVEVNGLSLSVETTDVNPMRSATTPAIFGRTAAGGELRAAASYGGYTDSRSYGLELEIAGCDRRDDVAVWVNQPDNVLSGAYVRDGLGPPPESANDTSISVALPMTYAVSAHDLEIGLNSPDPSCSAVAVIPREYFDALQAWGDQEAATLEALNEEYAQ